jgi:hypothetical protein
MKPNTEQIMDAIVNAYVLRGLLDPDDDWPEDWYNEMIEYSRTAEFPDLAAARAAAWDMAYNDWRRCDD